MCYLFDKLVMNTELNNNTTSTSERDIWSNIINNKLLSDMHINAFLNLMKTAYIQIFLDSKAHIITAKTTKLLTVYRSITNNTHKNITSWIPGSQDLPGQ